MKKTYFFIKKENTEKLTKQPNQEEKKKMKIATILTIIFVLLLVLITAVIVSWVAISHESFTTTELKPKMPYEIDGRKYVFPDVSIEGKCLMLKASIIENLRSIVSRVHILFEHLKIDYHATGGTLLGIVRHDAIPMPQDDDVDIAVEFIHRDFLFGDIFRQEANKFGLEPQFLAGTTTNRADRHGAALRLQLLEREMSSSETCDVFFLYQEKGIVFKIDGWLNGKLVPNSKEQFSVADVYPRNLVHVDGLDVWIPRNPEALLEKQYGKDVFTHAKIRPRLISHAFPMRFLRLLWVKSV